MRPPTLNLALLSLFESLIFLFITMLGLSLSIEFVKLFRAAAVFSLRDIVSATRSDNGNAFMVWSLGNLFERYLFAWQNRVLDWQATLMSQFWWVVGGFFVANVIRRVPVLSRHRLEGRM
ncbi:hypothetical protein BU16DRAFT_577822 [Lophium mytilinum]|uniref:Uncharacterized protein n=1 Tax=Lophium mytilinum TaxID=390894 RepID=A0A6A6RA80_9PEZI|nr:hypothetical protein BU16DRAFT_577822 [Lophium mytilinum]